MHTNRVPCNSHEFHNNRLLLWNSLKQIRCAVSCQSLNTVTHSSDSWAPRSFMKISLCLYSDAFLNAQIMKNISNCCSLQVVFGLIVNMCDSKKYYQISFYETATCFNFHGKTISISLWFDAGFFFASYRKIWIYINWYTVYYTQNINLF